MSACDKLRMCIKKLHCPIPLVASVTPADLMHVYQHDRKGGVSSRGVAVMTQTAETATKWPNCRSKSPCETPFKLDQVNFSTPDFCLCQNRQSRQDRHEGCPPLNSILSLLRKARSQGCTLIFIVATLVLKGALPLSTVISQRPWEEPA